MTTQKDGKIIIAGTTEVSNLDNKKFVITRFNNDGLVDESFGDGGIVAFNIDGSRIVKVNKIIVQDDNKILLCGAVTTLGKHDIALMRLNSDGSLDNNFGENGIIVKSIGLYDQVGYDEINDMQIQQDGKILLTGLKGGVAYEKTDFYIVRFLSNGDLDESFGEHGVIIPEGDFLSVEIVPSIDLSLPDKITIAGNTGTKSEVLLIRYNLDGTIDNSFGINGITLQVLPKMENGNPILADVTDMKILPDRSIWVFGTYYIKKYGTIMLIKFDENGQLDRSIGNGAGYIIPDFASEYTRAENVYITANNKMIATGVYWVNGEEDGFAAFSFRYNGSLDSSFGENGMATAGFGNFKPTLFDLSGAVQPDGKIVVGASVRTNEDALSHVGLIRFNGNGGVTQDNYVRIKRWMRKHSFTWAGSFMSKQNTAYTVQRSSDGKNFVSLSKVYAPDDKGNFSFEDVKPIKGQNYYRVSYEQSGKTIYSNVLLIEDDIAVRIFPNPAKTNIQVTGLPQGKTRLTIIDVSGNIKMIKTIEGGSGNIEIASLPKGHYIIKISTADNKITVEKFYKE